MFTANCCRYLSSKGYPITVITPGNNKEEIYRVVTELGASFEQVVLLGYPPFLMGEKLPELPLEGSPLGSMEPRLPRNPGSSGLSGQQISIYRSRKAQMSS